MIELCPAKKEDFEFYYNLRKEIHKFDSDRNKTWDDESQRNILVRHFYPKRYLIITTSGRKVGIVSFFSTRKSIQFRRFLINPKFRGKGIGTNVLKKAVSFSNEQKNPLFLQVFKSNKNAKKLCFRLGFIITEEYKTHCIMKYNN